MVDPAPVDIGDRSCRAEPWIPRHPGQNLCLPVCFLVAGTPAGGILLCAAPQGDGQAERLLAGRSECVWVIGPREDVLDELSGNFGFTGASGRCGSQPRLR